MKTYLDVCVCRCPKCSTPYADASWYCLELGCDVECGKCGESWNAENCATDRVLVEFELDEKGKVKGVSFSKL